MKMFAFLDERVSLRHQWSFCQRSESHEDEQAQEETQCSDLCCTDEPTVANGRRHDHVEEVDIVSSKDYDAGHNQNPCDTFEICIDENQYREHEVHHNRAEEWQVVVLDTCYEIGYLFRDVCVPDQHEL